MTVQRALISPTAFKISNPGYDVTTATASQLMFDAFNNRYQGIYMTGTILAGAFTTSGSTSTYTLNFGRTYAQPPHCFIGIQDLFVGGLAVGFAAANWASSQTADIWGNVSQSTGSLYMGYTATTTSLILNSYYTGSTFPATLPIVYFVMEG